ncbi:hypothetical protein [Mycolicibacterium sp. HS_4_1]
MSLLNSGTETVKVFPEETITDADGNQMTQASKIGTDYRARVHPISAIETQEVGFESKTRYRLRLVRYPGVLGAQSQVEWRGNRYSIDGEGMVHTGSSRTAHVEYVMVRK